MSITTSNGASNDAFLISNVNSIVLQSVELNNLDDDIKLDAKGSGVVFAQVRMANTVLMIYRLL